MSNSLNLELPYVEEAQAQKHVTVNEAFRRLDAVVQLAVADRTTTAPPGSPSEGDRYIVAAPATGAWSGHAGEVAAYLDGAWAYFAPQEGWLAYLADEDALAVFDGSSWTLLTSSGAAETAPKFGINTTADTTNRLSVRSNAALFAPAASGTGDVRIVATKDMASDVVSYLFQNNFSGRAEFGLIGGDDFSLKVSADGSAFSQAFVVDRTSAAVAFDQAITVAGTATLTGTELAFSNGLELSLGAAGDSTSLAIGDGALGLAAGGSGNTAVGAAALAGVTSGSNNVAVGSDAGAAVSTASGVTMIGTSAGQALTGVDNTGLGRDAFAGAGTVVTNCTALGAQASVSGSNEVQLGNSSTTTYAYGAVQDRSDLRDKADVRDTVLGLSFVRSLRPVDFRWDYREDYDGGAGRFDSAKRDGSRRRNRFHHGFIAQDIEALIESSGVDFGGYQDHAVNGGADVKSLGYSEFLAPVVRAIQELSDEVDALRRALSELG